MNQRYRILANELIATNTYQMILSGDTSNITKPGQFINIKIEDGYQTFLRRPISISTYQDEEMTIVYKVVGEGTKSLSRKTVNEELDILSPLGNGFTIHQNEQKTLIIGGGVGVPPLLELAKQLSMRQIPFSVVLGFGSKEDVFYLEDFKTYTKEVYLSTMDGSIGFKGTVVDLIKANQLDFTYIYACGPEKMLHALIKEGYNGQLSFEERMGCGFGACMGCSHNTITSYKRICVEGPVLETSEVIIHE